MSKKKISELQSRLMKKFPEIPLEVVEQIDIEIKTKVLIYQSENINKDISMEIYKRVSKYVNTKNKTNIKKKCNKLASEYLENNRVWFLQENWYCLLAYFITLATMIIRVINPRTEINDIVSFFMYLLSLILWLLIVQTRRFMGIKADRFLWAFNHHAPSWIIVSSLLFYTTVCITKCKIFWILVIVSSFMTCMWLTYIWYKRELGEEK